MAIYDGYAIERRTRGIESEIEELFYKKLVFLCCDNCNKILSTYYGEDNIKQLKGQKSHACRCEECAEMAKLIEGKDK